MAGVLAYVKFLSPSTQVIGVEPDDAACLDAALAAGEPVALSTTSGPSPTAPAVREIGRRPFAHREGAGRRGRAR